MKIQHTKRCPECLHRLTYHNSKGECRYSIEKGRATLMCDCKVHVKKK